MVRNGGLESPDSLSRAAKWKRNLTYNVRCTVLGGPFANSAARSTSKRKKSLRNGKSPDAGKVRRERNQRE